MSPPLIELFQMDLNAVVDKYREQGLTAGEAVGTLDIVKMELYISHRENADED
jgi:hypothetical protein